MRVLLPAASTTHAKGEALEPFFDAVVIFFFRSEIYKSETYLY